MYYEFDPASIPQATGLYFTITWRLAMFIAMLLFVLSIVDEASKPLRDQEPQYGRLLFRACALMAGLIIYRTIFLAIVAICQVISYMLFSMEDWGVISDVILKFPTDKGIFQMGIEDVMVGVMKYTGGVIEEIFFRIRYVLLALLYVIGPMAFVMGFWPATNKFIKGWFQNLLEFSFWIITLRVLQAIFASMMMSSVTAGINMSITEYLVFTTMYVVMVIATPAITGKFLSGESMGQLGSMALGAVGVVSGKILSTSAGKSFKKVAEGAKAGARRVMAEKILPHVPGGKQLIHLSRKLEEVTGGGDSAGRPKEKTAPKINNTKD